MLVILSKDKLFKLVFTTSARLAFIKTRTKKNSYTIGNSYNSIQNAAQVDKMISILLLVAKKNPIKIEFFMANHDTEISSEN